MAMTTTKEMGYRVGSVGEHPKWGEFVVRSKDLRATSSGRVRTHYEVVMSRTLESIWVVGCDLDRLKFRDYSQPSVYGVGYSYKCTTDVEKILRKKWSHMLMRLYCPKYQAKRPSYRDCTLHLPWLSLRVFVRDAADIPGYNELVAGHKLDLDKDLLVPGNRHYGPGLVSFVPAVDNYTDALSRGVEAAAQVCGKPVRCLSSGTVYASMQEASMCSSDTRPTISKHCRGEVSRPRWEYA